MAICSGQNASHSVQLSIYQYGIWPVAWAGRLMLCTRSDGAACFCRFDFQALGGCFEMQRILCFGDSNTLGYVPGGGRYAAQAAQHQF